MSDDSNKPERPVLEIFKEHLVRLGVKVPVCPICGNDSWGFLPDQAPLVGLAAYDFNAPAKIHPGGHVAPVALMACDRCSYILAFSWLPILRGANG